MHPSSPASKKNGFIKPFFLWGKWDIRTFASTVFGDILEYIEQVAVFIFYAEEMERFVFEDTPSRETPNEVMEFQLEIQRRLDSGEYPDRIFIDLCRRIIQLMPVPDGSADRSERFPKSVKMKLVRRYTACVSCGKGVINGNRHDPILEVHHIIPREYEGGESFENGLLVCRNCHGEIHCA